VKRKVLASLLVIAVVAGLVSAGTWAYFSDVETSEDDVFQAGTLNMEIADNDEEWFDGTPVTASWTSPAGLRPGQEFTTDFIRLKNVGSIDADYVYMRLASLSQVDGVEAEPEGPGSVNNIATKIELVSITEYSPNYGWDTTTFDTDTANVWLAYWGTTQDGSISLSDLVYAANPGGTSAQTGLYLYLASGAPYLPVGGIAQIQMTFKLMENTTNEYQGDRCTFNVDFIASNAGTADIDASITEPLSP